MQDEIQQYNLALLDVIKKLGSAQEELDLCLTQAKVELKAIRYASECKTRLKTNFYTQILNIKHL